MEKKGICVAGHMCVDLHYYTDAMPKKSELAHLKPEVDLYTGGAVSNTGLDLAILDPDLKVQLCGVVGNDPNGEFLLGKYRSYKNVDTSMVARRGSTAFSVIMNDLSDGTRTIFSSEGALKDFGEEDIDFSLLDASIFHAAYLMLLPGLDAENETYGTNMAALLHKVREMGVKTSIDVVSAAGEEARARLRKVSVPALKYTDYCCINELEAQFITGITLRKEDGTLLRENLLPALRKLKEFGVSTWAVIHCPELGAGLDENGNFAVSGSLDFPEGFLKGTCGAGDAFCAGLLYRAWKGGTLPEALRTANAVAAASLRAVGAVEGMEPVSKVMELEKQFGLKNESA